MRRSDIWVGVFLTVLLCGSESRADTIHREWSEIGMSSRTAYGMAYDSDRGRIVLFGGWGSSVYGDTWEWDGTLWTRRAISGPAPRYGHAMVYDSARHRVLLFGGQDRTRSFGDTWEWNGTNWTLRSTVGPSPRSTAMTYDARRGRVVLFAGGSHHADTWEWDGETWIERAIVGPSPRKGHTMAYDAARGRVVLFGGFPSPAFDLAPETWLGDTWEYDGQAWTQRPVSGPCARDDSAMVYDSSRSRIVLYGGLGVCGASGRDTWAWNGMSWTQLADSGPPQSSGHAMAYDVAHDRIVVLTAAGHSTSSEGTWQWDGSVWIQSVPKPPTTSGFVMAYDPVQNREIMLGNCSAMEACPTWEWNGTAWVPQTTQPAPLRYGGHAMASDSARGRIVLFGGAGTTGLGDTWEWNGAAWTRASTTGPGARQSHAMAYDEVRGKTVLFGGEGTTRLGDTWEWDGVGWGLRATTGPSPRSGHAVAYDVARHRVVMFGGQIAGQHNDGVYSGETWEWDGASWALQSTSGPSPRAGHAMTYDRSRGRVVLFGGSADNFNTFPEVWTWDGISWTLETAGVPPGRRFHAMTYDPARDRIVLYGGYGTGNGSYGDTWENHPCAPSTWYRDADGDGFGDPATNLSACDGPTGYVGEGTDCDDTDSTVYPNAPEESDGSDNQCSADAGYGAIDEIDDPAVFLPDKTTFIWPTQRHAIGYEVARGVSARFKLDCTILITSTNRISDAMRPPPGAAIYYLVRSALPREGSWGRNSDGKEEDPKCRPPG